MTVPGLVRCSSGRRGRDIRHLGPRRGPGLLHLGQAEVEHLRLLALGDEDVRGLDVAVDDAALVRGVERVGDLDRRVEQTLERQRPAADAVLQRLPARNSMAMNGWPSVGRRCRRWCRCRGGSSAEAALASRWKRSSACGSSVSFSGRNFERDACGPAECPRPRRRRPCRRRPACGGSR